MPEPRHPVSGLIRPEVETCGFLHVHEDAVARVRALLPREDTLTRLSDLFKVFGDGTRIRILYVLFEEEVCVCDIALLLGMTQSAVSHQLRILKQARLIKRPSSTPSRTATSAPCPPTPPSTSARNDPRQMRCIASKISIRCIWMAICSSSRTG